MALVLTAYEPGVRDLYEEWQPEGDYQAWAVAIKGYLWGLTYQRTLVGMMHGIAFRSPYPPQSRGLVDSYYVSPSHRHHAWRLWRHARRVAKALGVERVLIYCDHGTLPFWERHKFEISAYMMERTI